MIRNIKKKDLNGVSKEIPKQFRHSFTVENIFEEIVVGNILFFFVNFNSLTTKHSFQNFQRKNFQKKKESSKKLSKHYPIELPMKFQKNIEEIVPKEFFVKFEKFSKNLTSKFTMHYWRN